MTTALRVGVDLFVLAVLVVGVFHRRRSVKGRRGSFKGKLRVAEGELDGFSSRWKGGYGRWVRDVLVWNKAPLLLGTRLIAVDGTDASGIRAAANGEVRGLGKHPVVAPLLADHRSRLELATSDEDQELALGPFARTSAVGSLVRAQFGPSNRDELNDN